MISLFEVAALFLLCYVVCTITIVYPARWLGGKRTTFRVGFLVSILLYIFGFAASGMIVFANHRPPPEAMVAKCIVLLVQLIAIASVFRGVFLLSRRGTMGMVGFYLLQNVAIVVLLIFLVRPFLLEAFVIPTASMSPTLVSDDRFVVNKRLAPRRWDIIAYRVTDPVPTVFCKRLVGLPNEHIRFEGGSIYVDDKKQAAPSVVEGRYHAVTPRSENLSHYRDGETIALGPDEVFVVGDHVEASLDSRVQGPSKASAIVGVVDWQYWPLNRWKLFR